MRARGVPADAHRETVRWHRQSAQFIVSGGTIFCRVRARAGLTRLCGSFSYSGCGGSSRSVGISWLYGSALGQKVSMR
jgi:hypothetical protein